MYPGTDGVKDMNQATAYLQEMENALGFDKKWSAQVAAVMEVKMNMEHHMVQGDHRVWTPLRH